MTDLLKTGTIVVKWRILKAHLESCFTFLPSLESKFVFDYNRIDKLLYHLLPGMAADDSIQKLT